VRGFSEETFRRRRAPSDLREESTAWLWGTGLSYMALTAWCLPDAPDARFFMPGLIFCIVPVAEHVVALPCRRLWMVVLTVLAVAQGGAVLKKTYALRHVPAGVWEAIDYLREHKPTPNVVFMYPEGNYRLFPCRHEWYLNYRLRRFWKADNDKRLTMLRDKRVGAIVVKKHLVGKMDPAMHNLGLYPDTFVRDIEGDPRFRKVLDNKDVAIYWLPSAP
jgi:hypothetical protein